MPEHNSPQEEGRQHAYRTNRIPWFVHFMWVLFWILAIGYFLVNFVPALRNEFLKTP